MKRLVASPNLPSDCSAVIYGQKYAGILQKPLKLSNIESVLLPDNPFIDPRLAGHADLSVLHTEGDRVYLAPYLKGTSFAQRLQAYGMQIEYPPIKQSADYPQDSQLNICLMGKYVICNTKTACADIVDYLTNSCNSNIFPVRQGYSRCAVCVVDAESLITADRGIAQAAANGLQVLLIQAGHIRLDGFPYGFIGGAAFKLASDKLAFTGSLDAHPDRDAILRFLYARHIEPVFLSREPLFDIGSAIPIFEN